VFCSILSTQEAARARKKYRGNQKTQQSVQFSLLLDCSKRFLSTLQQNRTQSRLLHLFYYKESIKFPAHCFPNFQSNLLADCVMALALCFISHKVRFFNQSECALYLNLITKSIKVWALMEILPSERREGTKKGQIHSTSPPPSLKVVLHETIRNYDFKRNTG